MFGSCCLERFLELGVYGLLPAGPGGVVGHFFSRPIVHTIGVYPAMAVFLVMVILGASLLFRFSWMDICERIGTAIDTVLHWGSIRRAEAEDRRIGEHLLHLASDLPSAVEEFEAESVALIMQQRLGLPVEDLTVRYVKNALREAGNLPEFSMEESLGRIVKQANYVCDRLELQQLQQQEVMPVQNQAPVIQAQPNFGPTL